MGKTKKGSSHKFTLRQFIWNGFNLTVAVAFLGSLYALAADGKDGKGDNLGWHMIWIFCLMSLIVGVCAFAFAKLSRYHQQDNNGGAYIYTRGAFGKFIGFVVGTLNYIIVPMVFSNQILMFIKANFDSSMSVPNAASGFDPKNAWWSIWTSHLGAWSNLFYDSIGVLLAVGFSLFAFFGSKIYKKAGNYSLLVKWVTSGFFILFAIIAIFLPSSKGNANSWSEHSTFTFGGFAKAFSACFYYFTGFEVFATAGENLEEPEKNLSKGIIWVVVLSGLFYIVLTTIYMLAVAHDSTTQNINTGFWAILSLKEKWLGWLLYAGPIIMIICTIFMRGNTVAQMSLYGGTTLQPLSKEGYISHKFSELNSNRFPAQAMKLNVIIVGITISVWMFIPDIINGITGGKADFINVNTIISAASSFYILIYLFVLFALLKYTFANAIKTNLFEKVAYMLAALVLCVIFVYHYYDLINGAITATGDDVITNYVALGVEILFIVGVTLFIVLTYCLYYKPRLTKKINEHKQQQIDLDRQFRLMDGWQYLKGKFEYMFQGFSKKENRRKKFAARFASNKNKQGHDERLKQRKELFIKKMEKKMLKDYITYSQNVNKYNKNHHIDTHQEISINNAEAHKMFNARKAVILGIN